MKIALGSTSKYKINYLKEVLEEFKLEAEIIIIPADSKISNQPKTLEETKQGSINRAKESLVKDADISIGIEVGYDKNEEGKYEMLCFATVIDKNGHQTSSQSHRFLLPEYHQEILNKDLYLGDNLDRYIEKSEDPKKKEIDEIIRYRKPFIKEALYKVLHYLT